VAFAVLAEPVRHPDVSLRINQEAVWKQYQAGAEAFDQLAALIELEDRIKARSIARERHARLHL
jgi:hypothetical protein